MSTGALMFALIVGALIFGCRVEGQQDDSRDNQQIIEQNIDEESRDRPRNLICVICTASLTAENANNTGNSNGRVQCCPTVRPYRN